MAHFALLRRRQTELFMALDKQVAEREKWLPAESAAATKLQTKYRGARMKFKHKVKRESGSRIQRFIRG